MSDDEGWPHIVGLSFFLVLLVSACPLSNNSLTFRYLTSWWIHGESLFRLETFPSPRKVGVFSMEFLFQLEFLDSFY